MAMNNHLEWLTNISQSRFNPLDYPHFRVVIGQPLGTPAHTSKELEDMGMVGVYRVAGTGIDLGQNQSALQQGVEELGKIAIWQK